MSDNGGASPEKHAYNIIAQRGDPTHATTVTGHPVEKKALVIIPSPFDGTMIALNCADYHMEHFVYIDPLFERDLPKNESRSFWFAMCTCGSPAAIIGGADVARHEGRPFLGYEDNMLVCQHYYQTLIQNGYGWHLNQEGKQWR
jgi:hypothetical protein